MIEDQDQGKEPSGMGEAFIGNDQDTAVVRPSLPGRAEPGGRCDVSDTIRWAQVACPSPAKPGPIRSGWRARQARLRPGLGPSA